MRTAAAFTFAILVLPLTGLAQSNDRIAPQNAFGPQPGAIALAALRAPVQLKRAPSLPPESEYRDALCGGRHWMCIAGGSAVGFVVGAFVGSALIPKKVKHTEYSCSEFLGICGNREICEAHCDEPVTKVWIGGASGAILGGIAGYYLAKGTYPPY